MAWDFWTWLPTFILNRLGNKTLDNMAKSSLFAMFGDDITDWANSLSEGLDLEPEALFPKPGKNDNEANRPALKKLTTDLDKKKIPTAKTWHAALFEQWEAVRRDVRHPQQLFKVTPERAQELFEPLAERLSWRCSQDERYFKGTVIDELRKNGPKELSDQQIAEGIVTLLEDKHLLHAPIQDETPVGCYQSAKLLRYGLTEIMTKIPRRKRLHGLLDKLRNPSEKLMREIEKLGMRQTDTLYQVPREKIDKFGKALIAYRKACAEPVRAICQEYNIEPNDDLKSLLN